jgi:hypothetical protein
MNFLTPRQKQALAQINEFIEKNPDASLTAAARATRNVPQTYKTAVNKIKQAREERRVILRKAT